MLHVKSTSHYYLYKDGNLLKNRVKEFRTGANMTQQQLADTVKVSSRTIISLERGQYNPSIMLAYRIAEIFNTSIEELYCLASNKDQEDEGNEKSEN